MEEFSDLNVSDLILFMKMEMKKDDDAYYYIADKIYEMESGKLSLEFPGKVARKEMVG